MISVGCKKLHYLRNRKMTNWKMSHDTTLPEVGIICKHTYPSFDRLDWQSNHICESAACEANCIYNDFGAGHLRVNKHPSQEKCIVVSKHSEMHCIPIS
jgi:hypothetical protein